MTRPGKAERERGRPFAAAEEEIDLFDEIRAVPQAWLSPAVRGGRLETLKIPGWSDALVYLPYGYDAGDQAYSVFYLLHGGGGGPESFFSEDRLLLYQLDHMIGEGKMPPLIVAAPSYYAPGCGDKGIGASGQAVAAFPPVLRDRIVPAVDGAFRTLPDRRHRAVGGFSMGGVASWQAFLDAAELFYWYMPMSGDCWAYGELGGGKHDQKTAALLAEAAKKHDFYIHALTGGKDIAYPNLNAQIEAMRAYPDLFRFGDNIRYSVLENGWHDYPYIRRYIGHALPEFFRERNR